MIDFTFERSWKDYNEFTIIPTATLFWESGEHPFKALQVSAFAWKFSVVIYK